MTDLSELKLQGVFAKWPKRSSVIKTLRGSRVRSYDRIDKYNTRGHDKNSVKVVPAVPYGGIGRDLQFEAIAQALEGNAWLPSLASSVAYGLFSWKLDYFWHENFREIYRESGRVLNMFNTGLASVDMAFCFLLGWEDDAIYQGYLIHSILNRKHYSIIPYEEEHQRGQAFMLRLFADWRGDVSHQWPSYAYDEPIYNGLLERWRDPDCNVLVPWLLAACDRHTHETRQDTETIFYDFGDYVLIRLPIEMLMLFRLREIIGLQNPVIDHPLMEAPFASLPLPQPRVEPDEYMKATLQRVREDWPMFDKIVALDTVRNNQGSDQSPD